MTEKTDQTKLITVIIPTFSRPHHFQKALTSVLAQTFKQIEILVVTEPGDPAIKIAESSGDKRIRILKEHPRPLGGLARNIGISHSTGKFVAFLDDDDEWLSEKLEKQFEVASACSAPVLIHCKAIARTPTVDFIYPRRLPAAHEQIGDYLFCRRGLFAGETLIQTSCILVSADLIKRVNFNPLLKTHQDWDVVIRMLADAQVKLIYIDEPLVVWHIESDRPSTSKNKLWQESLEWIMSIRHLLGKRAVFYFFMLEIVRKTPRNQLWRVWLLALKNGDFSFQATFIALAQLLIPERMRRFIRSLKHATTKGRS